MEKFQTAVTLPHFDNLKTKKLNQGYISDNFEYKSWEDVSWVRPNSLCIEQWKVLHDGGAQSQYNPFI